MLISLQQKLQDIQDYCEPHFLAHSVLIDLVSKLSVLSTAQVRWNRTCRTCSVSSVRLTGRGWETRYSSCSMPQTSRRRLHWLTPPLNCRLVIVTNVIKWSLTPTCAVHEIIVILSQLSDFWWFALPLYVFARLAGCVHTYAALVAVTAIITALLLFRQ